MVLGGQKSGDVWALDAGSGKLLWHHQFGKGTAQRLIPLRAIPAMQVLTNEPGQLKVTNSKFYRASGASTELRGVVPDIVLPSLLNETPDFGPRKRSPSLSKAIGSPRIEFVSLTLPSLGLMSRSMIRR